VLYAVFLKKFEKIFRGQEEKMGPRERLYIEHFCAA
jgi:hypothetical protein